MRTWRVTDPTLLVLSNLAGGPRRRYALTKDKEPSGGESLGPGTLFDWLSRPEAPRRVGPLAPDGRRRTDRLTTFGAAELRVRPEEAGTVARIGLSRQVGGAR